MRNREKRTAVSASERKLSLELKRLEGETRSPIDAKLSWVSDKRRVSLRAGESIPMRREISEADLSFPSFFFFSRFLRANV